MTAEQRMRMRRFEVVCDRAIARLQGVAEPTVEQVLQKEPRVIRLTAPEQRSVASDAMLRIGKAFVRLFQVDRLMRVWWWRMRALPRR